MYQPKVNKTQKYEDSQGSHIVTSAKLILIEDLFIDNNNSVYLTTPKGEMCVDPILISETEEMYDGDYIYGKLDNKFNLDTISIGEDANPMKAGNFHCWKVLALPEHFSDNHLQAIVDGKMEDGDEVLVKCEDASQESQGQIDGIYINLDQQNHITLFPAKQSLEEAAEEHEVELNSKLHSFSALGSQHIIQAFKAGAEWAKNNNY